MLFNRFLYEFAFLTLVQVVLKKIVMLVHCVDGGSLLALVQYITLEKCLAFMFFNPSLVYVEWLPGVSPHSHVFL